MSTLQYLQYNVSPQQILALQSVTTANTCIAMCQHHHYLQRSANNITMSLILMVIPLEEASVAICAYNISLASTNIYIGIFAIINSRIRF